MNTYKINSNLFLSEYAKITAKEKFNLKCSNKYCSTFTLKCDSCNLTVYLSKDSIGRVRSYYFLGIGINAVSITAKEFNRYGYKTNINPLKLVKG